MRYLRLPLAAVALALCAPAAAEELVLDRASGFVVPAQVNGTQLRLRVDPGASGLVMINPAAAARASLQPNKFKSWTASVGPVKLQGQGQLAKAEFAGTPAWLRFLWFERDVSAEADGLISIAALPYDRITLKLAPAAAGERRIDVPVSFTEEIGLHHPFTAIGPAIPIQFSTLFPQSLATAAAGAKIAVPYKGGWAGAEGRSPIRFGIARPTRPMELRKPIPISGLALERLLVRTADHRAGYVLPADASEDQDEIVVTGASKQPPRSNITIGQDLLGACSSLTYDRAAETLSLSCRIAPPASAPDIAAAKEPALPSAN